MAVTQNEYTGNGSATTYSFTFPYLQTTDVKVKLDGVTQATTAYTFPTATTVQMNSAPGNNVKVLIYRDTGNDNKKATFYPGSAIKAEDLNDDFDQILYTAQEIDNYAMTTLGDDTMIGNLQMGENQLVFEGATADAHETSIGVVDPTADRTINFPNVSGTVITTGDTGTVTSTILAANSVDSSELVDGSIDTSHIADLQVTTAKIANNAITAAKIAPDTITDAEIATDAVTATELANNAVDTAAIANDAVTQAKIANDAVGADQLASNSVVSASIVDGTIVAGDIASNAITTVKIADDSVTSAKIADNAVGNSELATNAVATANIQAGNITNAKIADNAINARTIEANAVGASELADNAVDTAAIADNAVTSAKIAANAVTTSELADAELTTLAGMQSGTASILASSTALTATNSEINAVCDGKTVQTTISDTDASYPTSGAVVDYVAAQIAPLGGLEVIANEDSFPTQPASGVVISIADAGGIVVNGSGVSTTARTSGNGSDNVTINGFPSTLHSTTLADSMGLLVSSTGSSNTYTYHKLLGKEDDIKNLSDDINDFNARYRIASSAPSSNNDDGDLYFDTTANKMKVYNASSSSWDDVAAPGNFFINTISSSGGSGGGSATFNGTATRFTLSNAPSQGAQQCIVSVNGVIQKPNSGTSPSEGFAIDGNDIIFAAAPATSSPYFIITLGNSVNIGTPSDNTVATAKIQNLAVTTGKIAADAVDGTKIADDAVGAEHIEVLDADLQMTDAGKIKLGTDNDLEVFHSGSNSQVVHNGTGNLYLDAIGASVNLRSGDNAGSVHNSVVCNMNAGVNLYYDNNPKLETLSSGVKITGQVDIYGNQVHLYNATDTSNTYFVAQNTGAGNAGIKMKNTDGEWLIIANDNLRFYDADNSTERLTITSAGKVGIGTVSPVGNLHLDGGSGDPYMYIQRSGAGDAVSTLGGIIFKNSTNALAQIDVRSSDINDGYIRFYTMAAGTLSERLRIRNDGGITFNGDTAANNALSDYEEGTWTPAPDGTGQSYSWQKGRYTKIGNTVLYWFDVSWTGMTGSLTDGRINGLPFTGIVSYQQAGYGAVSLRAMNGLESDMRIYGNSSYIGGSYIQLQHFNSSGTEVLTDFLASGRVTGEGFYYVNNAY